jgi:GNAT superfamily N-acetyltransferase
MTKEELRAKYDIREYVEPTIEIPEKPASGLVLLVGPSGSGKSTILRDWFPGLKGVTFGGSDLIDEFSSLTHAEELLTSCGLRSIPTWFRPYRTLSNGEAHRAYCAKSLDEGKQYIDEFSSVVDRDTAKSLAVSINNYYKRVGGLLVIATCHDDIEDWLQPTQVYDAALCSFRARRSLRRPSIEITIYPCSVKDWVRFKNHHYLTAAISKSCHSYIVLWQGRPVGFSAIIHGCSRYIHTYWRESRLVVLPEFQGMGIGFRVSEAIAGIYTEEGKRFFSKTAHPALGEKREVSPKWRPTSTNKVMRKSYIDKDGNPRDSKGYGKTKDALIRDANRVCYSHEFIGGRDVFSHFVLA